MEALRRWLVMAILCFSGGIIFMLPFLREVYYIPVMEAFDFDNTQLGVIMSVFGLVSLLSYFPGGWIADRYSARKLMSSSLLGVGVVGLYFSTFPSYWETIAIHAFWGACISLVFWGAMIKSTRAWAPAAQQGRAFGILESGRGVSEVLSSTIFLAIFAWLGSKADALADVIILFSLTNIALALLAWLILDDAIAGQEQNEKIGAAQVVQVLKMPMVWLIAVVVLAGYSAYWGTYYFAPYATEVYAMSVVLGGAVAVGKMWIKPAAAMAAGFIADRNGVARTTFAFLLLATGCFALFVFLPAGVNFVVPMLINVTLVSIAVFALRGIYFALFEEAGIPASVTGTAAGVVSAVGFTPDVFMPLLGGILLDKYPGVEGYRYYYGVIAFLCALGAVAAWMIMRNGKNTSQ